MARFGLLFAVIVTVLFAGELTPMGQIYVVEPWTSSIARIAMWLASAFDPHVGVDGFRLFSTTNGFSVTILAGCNGLEAMIVLIAAILAYPAPWKHRVTGIVVGVVAIQVLNLVRIVSLFYLGQWSLKVFEWAHLYGWQVLIMLDVLIVWLLWLRTIPRSPPTTAPA
ncbi:MAG TPA: exosortase H [Usitatibacter sp.]